MGVLELLIILAMLVLFIGVPALTVIAVLVFFGRQKTLDQGNPALRK